MPTAEDLNLDGLDKPPATPQEVLERSAALGRELKKVAAQGSDLASKVEHGEKLLAEFKADMRAIAEANADRGMVTDSEHGLRRFKNSAGGLVLCGYGARDRDGEKVIGAREDYARSWQPGLLDGDAPVCGEWHKELRELLTSRTLAAVSRRVEGSTKYAPTPMHDDMIRRHLERAPAVIKAAITGATGAGSEWVDTYTVPELAARLLAPLQVAGAFPVFNMVTKVVNWPFAASIPRAYKGGQPTEPTGQRTSSHPSTSLAWTAEMFRTRLFAQDEIDEDSVFAFRGEMLRVLATSLLVALDECMINGDTTATHQDTGISAWNTASLFAADATFGGTDDTRRAFKGLRRLAFDASQAADHSAQTTYKGSLDLCRLGLPGAMGLATQGDLVDFVSLKYLFGTVYADSNLLTVEKYGTRALNVAGEIGTAYGVRIVPTEMMTADLAASGLYTGSGSKTGHVLVNRQGFLLGVRRGASTEVQRDIVSGGVNIVGSARWAFAAKSSQVGAYYAYNL